MSLKSDCISAWNLDGNSNDSAGSNNATAVGVTYSAVTGSNIQAAYMDGTATIKATSFALGSNDFTFTIRCQRSTTGTNQYILGSINPSGQNASASILIRFDSGNTVSAFAFQGSSSVSITSSSTFSSTSSWYSIVYKRTGSTLELIVNNISEGTASITGSINTSVFSFGIGCAGEYNPQKFNGYIDYVNYFNVSINNSNLYTLYNSGNGLQYPFYSGGFITWFNSQF